MKFTLQGTILGIVGALLLASISYFGASILKAVEKVNNDTLEISLIKKDISELVKDVSSIQATLSYVIEDEKINELDKNVELLKLRVKNLEDKQ